LENKNPIAWFAFFRGSLFCTVGTYFSFGRFFAEKRRLSLVPLGYSYSVRPKNKKTEDHGPIILITQPSRLSIEYWAHWGHGRSDGAIGHTNPRLISPEQRIWGARRGGFLPLLNEQSTEPVASLFPGRYGPSGGRHTSIALLLRVTSAPWISGAIRSWYHRTCILFLRPYLFSILASR
jgi:hypothetical protein